MNKLVEKIIKSEISSLFTIQDCINLGINKKSVDELLQKAVMNSEIIRIKDDIYTINKMFRKKLIIDEVLAQKLVPDSYVSMESVLSDISWIPEAVYCVTSVTSGNNRLIETKYGRYSYVNLPQKNVMAGVRIIDRGVYNYKRASPLKSLADNMLKQQGPWRGKEINSNIAWICDELLKKCSILDYKGINLDINKFANKTHTINYDRNTIINIINRFNSEGYGQCTNNKNNI